MSSQLAVKNGPKAITVDTKENWKRPVEEEKKVVNELIDSGFISGSGCGLPKEFEEEFREYTGCKYVLTFSHGHLALASAFFAAGLGPGDEIIHPTIGYLGSYAGALHVGAKIVFCESDPKTLLADPDDIEKRITPKTRVISPIHFNGRVFNLDRLLNICEKNNIVLVEDAAHAHGSEWKGKKIGNTDQIACFSLQGILPGGKPICGGEGGIITTNNRLLYERCLAHGHLHRVGVLDEFTEPTLKQLDEQLLGYKFRAHPLAMAIAKVNLKNLDYRIANFAENRDKLVTGIKGLPGVEIAHNYPGNKGSELFGSMKFIYDAEALHGLNIEKFCEAMEAEGIKLIYPGFRKPDHLKNIYTKDMPGLWGKGHPGPANIPLPRYKKGDYPISEKIVKNVFGLTGWIEPAEGLIDQVILAFKKVVENHKQLL